MKYCKVCHNICDDEMCSICADPKRDQSTVCVVENIKEVMAIEIPDSFVVFTMFLEGLFRRWTVLAGRFADRQSGATGR